MNDINSIGLRVIESTWVQEEYKDRFAVLTRACLLNRNIFLSLKKIPKIMQTEIVSNLAHRLQLLEFIHRILSYSYNRRRKGEPNILFETVFAYLQHEYCVVSASILEGIGALLYNKGLHKEKVSQNDWTNAVIREYQERKGDNNSIHKEIKDIVNYRNKLHLDALDPNEDKHFNIFTNNEIFLSSAKTMKDILTQLQLLPQNCALRLLPSR